MGKRFNAPKIDETPPSGPVTDAEPPLPVVLRYRWNYGPADPDGWFVVQGWAMAWTKDEVLVYWRDEDIGAQVLWFRRDQVRRRES